jgi:hypothetical protein
VLYFHKCGLDYAPATRKIFNNESPAIITSGSKNCFIESELNIGKNNIRITTIQMTLDNIRDVVN